MGEPDEIYLQTGKTACDLNKKSLSNKLLIFSTITLILSTIAMILGIVGLFRQNNISSFVVTDITGNNVTSQRLESYLP